MKFTNKEREVFLLLKIVTVLSAMVSPVSRSVRFFSYQTKE